MSKKDQAGSAGLATPQAQGGLATPVPDFLKGMAGQGNENVTRENLAVPRIVLLQALSPEVTPGDQKYIEAARPSDLMNTVTNELVKGTVGLLVVNTYFTHEFAVFKKREAGGGFKGTFASLTEAQARMANDPEKDQLEVSEQDVHYVLILNEERQLIGEAAIVMASTKLSVSRKWNSFIQMSGGQAPRFAQVWRLKTVSAKNAKGTYFNYSVAPSGFITEDLVGPATALYKAVKDGAKAVERTGIEEDGGDHASAPVDAPQAGAGFPG